jgi:hypothetical protein
MIGIDAMVLIYAGVVPSKNDPTDKTIAELQFRSKLLLHMMGRQRIPIVPPTVAVSELLVPVPADQHGKLIAQLQSTFLCPTFDIRAASIAADLFARHRQLPRDSQYSNRQLLRADVMIIASVKSFGALEFYSHDTRARKLADLVMKGMPLPTRDPDDIFLEHDMRRGEV